MIGAVPMDPGLLLIPGPVPLHPRVLEEFAKPALPHYGDAWVQAFTETVSLMRYLWSAPEHRVFPLAGPGHTGLESLAYTFLRPGDRVAVLSDGFFGDRMREVLLTHRLKADVVASPWGAGPDLDGLRNALKRPTKAVAVVHNETSTGVTTLFRSSDAAFGASQKCLAAPAGITPVAVAPSLWEATDPSGADGWYLNLFTWERYAREWGEWHPTPTTISSNLFYAFHRALLLVKEEGLEARYARHAKASARLRDGLAGLGFAAVAAPDLVSNTVTCMSPPQGIDANTLVKRLRLEHNITISGGLGPLRGKTVRVGTMGTQAEPDVVDRLLDAVRSLV